MATTTTRSAVFTRRRVTSGAAIAALLVAMFFGTTIKTGEGATDDARAFNAADFAAENYESKILPDILDRANDVVDVSTAIQADPAAASEEYGVVLGTSAPVYSVSFTGVAGVAEGGIMPVTVEGMPEGVTIRVQMGPAINGTALRDATGLVTFPQFVNQIDYQDAGSALNNVVKESVLADIDAASLNGKTVSMVGVFQYLNPASYLITPVQIEVES